MGQEKTRCVHGTTYCMFILMLICYDQSQNLSCTVACSTQGIEAILFFFINVCVRIDSPLGVIPTLEFDGKIISGSTGIARWIAEDYGKPGYDLIISYNCTGWNLYWLYMGSRCCVMSCFFQYFIFAIKLQSRTCPQGNLHTYFF